jgi:Mlc titration factor MtfA (ptsG expression regulator)
VLDVLIIAGVGLALAAGIFAVRPLLRGVLAMEARRDRKRPLPQGWMASLEKSVPLTRRLSAAERTTLLLGARELIETVHWEGCGGFTLTPDMQLVIAAQACLLTLAIPGEPFPGLREVLVYPAAFVPRHVCDPRKWLASSEPQRAVPLQGEAWGRQVIVLGWEPIRAGVADPQDGHNVVLHEFAHELDAEYQLTPPALAAAVLPRVRWGGVVGPVEWWPRVPDAAAWRRVLEESYERLCAQVDAGTPSVMDHYGATKPAEFFAVATEVFFERPRELKEEDPDLYGQLQGFYRQDPASALGR